MRGSDEISCTVKASTKPPAARSGVIGTPDGAAEESSIERIAVPPTGIVRVGGAMVIVAVTTACWLAVTYPVAEAVMFTTPMFRALTWGWVAGVLAPAGIYTL